MPTSDGTVYANKVPSPPYLLYDENAKLKAEIDKSKEALLDASTAYKEMIGLLRKNKDLLEEQIELIKLQRPVGRVYDMSLTLAKGSQLVHIDFIAGMKGSMSVLPIGSNLDFPFAKLYSLEIANDGPATIVYSVNNPRGNVDAAAQLQANESRTYGPFNFPTFETLNIALLGGSTTSASVRIVGLA